MTQVTKRVSFFLLLALLSSTTVLFAQDTETVTIVGSGIVNSIVESLAEANETDSITISTTGTSAGLEQFCQGNADVATSIRPISADEDATCISNEIAYGEFLVAHSIVAFAVNPGVTVLECLTVNDLNQLYAPSATSQMTNWTAYDETIEDLPITFILPQDNTVEYAILDSIVVGDGLRRADATYDNTQDAIEQISETDGAIAVIPLSNNITENEGIVLLDVNYNTTTGCAGPSLDNVENRLYNVSQQMFMYVNRESLDDHESLQDLMDFITSSESAEVIETLGFTAPSEDTYMLNADILANEDMSRQFSGTESNFTIPLNLLGQIDVSGAANAYNLLDSASGQLTSNNQQLVINIDIEGQTAGIRRLCNGETSIAILESELSENALDGCEANDITTFPIELGSQATVLVANEADTHASCLTTDQLNTIWRAGSTDTIMNWTDVDETFPDQNMTLFGLSTSNSYSDILLKTIDGAVEPVRRDTELSNDALFRAAAVGNVPGALTYMSWTDYARVLGNNQQNIQLVSIDSGSGCVAPSDETISDSTYPLARPASLLVNEAGLADINVQSYLWQLFSDQGWTLINREGFVGIDFGDLPALRSELETQFSLLETKYAQTPDSPDAESTAEPTADDSTTESESDGDESDPESDDSEETSGD